VAHQPGSTEEGLNDLVHPQIQLLHLWSGWLDRDMLKTMTFQEL